MNTRKILFFFLYVILIALIIAELFSVNVYANEIEKIVITASHINRDLQAETSVKVTNPDLASWLISVPGANINRNGPLTGIAQYRGLFGDRIATTINGHTIIGAGPNAMDSPLSYGPTFLVTSMSVYQGITPVTAGLDTLGGAIEVTTLKAETDNSSDWQTNGQLRSAYRDNNSAKNLSGLVNLSKQNFAILAYTDWQKANDKKSGNNITIWPTRYKKNQAGTDIRYFYSTFGNDAEIGFSYDYTDTQSAGTPALPMDIKSIFAHRFSVNGTSKINNWQLNYQLGYLNSDHVMDNFSLRQNNDKSKYRRNDATANTVDFKISASNDNWEFGLDGYLAQHNSIISNPNNIMFNIGNFHNVKDNRLGVYGQWQGNINSIAVDAGVRIKHIKINSGNIDHSMAMKNASIKQLRDNFNHADKLVSKTNIDVAVNFLLPINLTVTSSGSALTWGVGIKQRAPSYQEQYLWLPMESTAGLADGKTYIGNINLNSETAYQVNIGYQISTKNWLFSGHGFYQKISHYIQGTPSMNINANRVAMMMTGKMPLQYTNVSAKLYGVDGNASYKINKQLKLSAIVSYVRGKRDDITDNLYRIAPLNGQLKLSYQTNASLQTSVMMKVSAAQNNVSLTNNEQKSSGYAIINADLSFDVNDKLVLKAGVNNLLNHNYSDHLGGYNRVAVSDIAVMSRLPEQGRTLWAELNYYF